MGNLPIALKGSPTLTITAAAVLALGLAEKATRPTRTESKSALVRALHNKPSKEEIRLTGNEKARLYYPTTRGKDLFVVIPFSKRLKALGGDKISQRDGAKLVGLYKKELANLVEELREAHKLLDHTIKMDGINTEDIVKEDLQKYISLLKEAHGKLKSEFRSADKWLDEHQ